MAMACPISGCKSEGMCIHKTMMLGVGAIVVIAVLLRFAGIV